MQQLNTSPIHPTQEKEKNMYHFGVNIRPGKYGFYLTRENYAIISTRNTLSKFPDPEYADEEGKFYTQEWCEMYQKLCLENFDANMRFFADLDHDEFDAEVKNFLAKAEIDTQHFEEVTNLDDYKGKAGYYLMVLDKYCQAYVGTSDDISARVRQHWTRRVPFDHLLLPMFAVKTSLLSINSFRALDTTRLYALPSSVTYEMENDFIDLFSPKFMANRMNGGRLSGPAGLLTLLNGPKQREL